MVASSKSLSPSIFAQRHVHLMGIGGAGMSALVPVLQRAGASVSGCDLAAGNSVSRLRQEGCSIFLGHDPSHLAGVDIVVFSSALPRSNPELRAAEEAGITILSRQACMAELLRGQRTLAVAGSHGKTSTTWMAAHLLMHDGADPLVLVGGEVASLGGSGARLGASNLVVAEVDESDGGFAHCQPSLAVITNLEAEHLEHYGSFSGLCAAFAAWLRRMGPQAVVVIPQQGLPEAVLEGVQAEQRRVGVHAGDVHATDISYHGEGTRCRCCIDGQDQGWMEVPIPGVHMLQNALMAVAAVQALRSRVALSALASSGRVHRRFTDHGRQRGVRVIEDYAHHPTEIRATLAAAALAGGRLHVLFQPHRYSRTRDLLSDFASAFDAAHALVVLPTYAASEQAIAGADAASLSLVIAEHRQAQGCDRALTQYAGQRSAALAFICAHARHQDSILVLGAGDINECIPDLLRQLAQSSEEEVL